MTCYAMACHQEHPCALQSQCEAVWHACTPPEPKHVQWTCWTCGAHWTWRLMESHGTWVRDPRTPPKEN